MRQEPNIRTETKADYAKYKAVWVWLQRESEIPYMGISEKGRLILGSAAVFFNT